MLTITCAGCQKRYKVDVALAGKKVRCKSCGGSIAIPSAPAASASQEDDLLAGLTAAAAAEAAAPPSPSAGRRVAADDAGGRSAGRPGAISAAPFQKPMPALQRRENRDARGVRRNEEYEGPILGWLETLLLGLSKWAFAVLALFVIGLSIATTFRQREEAAAIGATIPTSGYLKLLVPMPLALTLWALVQVQLTALGVRLTGMGMKFKTPDGLIWRVLGPQVLAFLYCMVGWLFITALEVSRGETIILASLKGMFSVPYMALVTLPVTIPTHFFATWLLLRLKLVEALVTWIAQWVAMAIFACVMAVGFAIFAVYMNR